MKKLFCIFIFFFAAQNLAAQSFDSNIMSKMISQIAVGKGKVTKAEYDGFWQSIGITEIEQKKSVIDMMRRNFIMMQSYQSEVWKCAEQAWISQTMPQCNAAKLKIKEIKVEMEKVGQGEVIKKIEANTNNLLTSASKRQVTQGPEGTGVPLTLENIRTTRKNMDDMLARFEQVLRVKY